jgi:membrane-bound ClpP family serine protease
MAAARLDEMALYSLSGALLKYVILQIPGWVLAGVVGWLFVTWFDVPAWAAIALVSLWVAKDFALFPYMRRFYESASGEPRIVGDAGVAVTDLNPRGFVRIHGELWQAEAGANTHIAKGCGVCVRDIRGLLLVVDALPAPYDVFARRPTPATRPPEDEAHARSRHVQSR